MGETVGHWSVATVYGSGEPVVSRVAVVLDAMISASEVEGPEDARDALHDAAGLLAAALDPRASDAVSRSVLLRPLGDGTAEEEARSLILVTRGVLLDDRVADLLAEANPDRDASVGLDGLTDAEAAARVWREVAPPEASRWHAFRVRFGWTAREATAIGSALRRCAAKRVEAGTPDRDRFERVSARWLALADGRAP